MKRFSTSLLGDTKTILLASDASQYSDGAVREAIYFGQACAAKVILLHVVKIDAESLRTANAKVVRQQQLIAPYLDGFRKTAQEAGVEFEILVLGSSVPENAIVEQAILRKADIIIMGRHGKAGRLYLMVGSMTSKLIGLGFPKVLTVCKNYVMQGRHVLVFVEDSPSSRLAVQEALSLAGCSTLERLTVLAVAKREKALPEALAMAEHICDSGRKEWPNVLFDPVAKIGHPSNVIVRTAEEGEADMIILGGMDQGAIPRMFAGRVVKEVCGWAHCPVLVVTATQNDSEAPPANHPDAAKSAVCRYTDRT